MIRNRSCDHSGTEFVDFDVLSICVMKTQLFSVFESSDLDDYLSKNNIF